MSYGSKQTNFHRLENTLTVSSLNVVCFDAVDFTCIENASTGSPVNRNGAPIYQWNGVTEEVDINSRWTKEDFSQNAYWSRMNLNSVDTAKYLPVYAKYTLRISGNPVVENTRIRVDLVTFKPRSLIPSSGPATGIDLLLPTALGSLTNLATPTANRINNVYFKRYFTRFCFLNSAAFEREGEVGEAEDTPPQGTTANIKYMSFTVHPKKPRHQAIPRPTVANLDDNPSIQDGNFGVLNVGVGTPLWVIISCDDLISTDNAINIQCSRTVCYRDAIGSNPIF